MEKSIFGVAIVIFFNHGQCCCAASRLYVEKSISDKVVAGVADQAKQIKMGHGMDPSTQMWPLVSDEQQQRVLAYLESGFAEEAEAGVSEKRMGNKGYFVEPTILVNTNSTMKVIQEAIFGPVVCAEPFTNAEDVITKASDNVYELAAAVWTKDLSMAHRLADELRAGTVWINCHNIFDASLPFGGTNNPAWGGKWDTRY